ncbi:MAG: nucleotidyl transferase AbiEii/AbiGii toxin family protein [Anaerolineae bacterium]|nr:nucleotidyl transferase AbiEii/AbiGii toxin family protein [Anaerolineae bacterium]MBL6966067.1 nucleotidyl transferase AbiEii/AbiGii toxin family protein [Anaerolineales bacterium]
MATLIQTMQNVLDSKDPLLAVETKRIILKEVLQAHVLNFLYNHTSYRNLNFYGGTCLHVIYELNRLSEDLDFDNQTGLELSYLHVDLLAHFQQTLGYTDVFAKQQEGAGGVLRITLKFPLLYELGLSPHASEALHLKVEISHHDQVCVVRRTPVLVYGRSLVATHFSLETMMAGKMLACLERSFESGKSGATVKGRDFYDLLWFMQKRIHPLEEKLARDGQEAYTLHSAMLALQKKIGRIQKRDLAVDLLPMFESRNFIEAWLDVFHENFNTLMQAYLAE